MGGERSCVRLLGERVSPGHGYWGGGKKRDGHILLTGITVFLELADVTDSVWQIGAQLTDRQG